VNERAKLPKVPTFTPWGAIYREEEEVVVYVYSIGGVENYKKVRRCCK